MTKEPHERLTEVRNTAMFGRECTTDQITELDKVTYEKFMEFKKKFLNNLKF